MTHDSFVFFPQWQGSGLSTELWAAAQALRPHLPSIPFREVPVALDPIQRSSHGILGHEAILAQQQEAARLIIEENPERIFSLGGDCSIEIVPVSWLNRRYDEKLAVIWLDAHGDLNSPESSPSGHFHGMPLRYLLGAAGPFTDGFQFSKLHPSQVVLAGVRELDAPESRFIQESSIMVCSVEAIEADPGVIGRHVLQQGLREAYLHIDLDVLEPTEFPHLKCPTAGGLRIETLLSVIGSIKSTCHTVGFSILEYTRIQGGQGLADINRIIQAGIGDWVAGSPEQKLAKTPESR
jgi:arginase